VDTSVLGERAKLSDSGELKAMVETVLPQSEAPKAQELNEGGHARGKLVLKGCLTHQGAPSLDVMLERPSHDMMVMTHGR